MNKIAGFIAFDVFAIGMYFLCANAHIDIFPCEIAERARISDALVEPPLQKTSGMCSLLAHNRGVDSDGAYQRLTTVGWAALIGLCVAVGAVAGGIVTVATRKR